MQIMLVFNFDFPFQVETACYTINVRGSEVPKHMLASFFAGGNRFEAGNKADLEDGTNNDNFED